MKLTLLILLGIFISYLLILLDELGFIIGIGFFIGIILKILILLNDIHKKINLMGKGRG